MHDDLQAQLESDPLLSLDDIEWATGLPARIIRRAVRAGRLRHVTLGGRAYVRRSWLAQWIDGGDSPAVSTDGGDR